MSERFTSRTVVELTGITPRQLQWWDEQGIVVPRRQGHSRIYSLEDLAEVAVICQLRSRGFSLQRIRKMMRSLKADFSKRLAEIVNGSSPYHLLTDGRRLYLESSPEQIVDILENSRQPMLAVCVSDAVQRVRAVIRGGKKNRSAQGSTRAPQADRKRAS